MNRSLTRLTRHGAGAPWRLPDHSVGYVTDAGLETDLIFHQGVDLPCFAAYPLLGSEPGRALLENYYAAFAAVARDHGAGLLLETATWRANPDWGEALGDDATVLDRVNRIDVEHLQSLRERADLDGPVLISGTVGPRGDGYAAATVDPDEAADYHRPQLAAFAGAGADLATAYTLTGVGEAIGIVRAGVDVNLPVAISFTVETDGRLPDGTELGEAIESLDDATDAAAAHLLVNCAHPDHISHALAKGSNWVQRIAGLRVNASRLSHAELDEAQELDEGDIGDLARVVESLAARLPCLSIVWGCCGTDARHVQAMWSRHSTTQWLASQVVV